MLDFIQSLKSELHSRREVPLAMMLPGEIYDALKGDLEYHGLPVSSLWKAMGIRVYRSRLNMILALSENNGKAIHGFTASGKYIGICVAYGPKYAEFHHPDTDGWMFYVDGILR